MSNGKVAQILEYCSSLDYDVKYNIKETKEAKEIKRQEIKGSLETCIQTMQEQTRPSFSSVLRLLELSEYYKPYSMELINLIKTMRVEAQKVVTKETARRKEIKARKLRGEL